MSESARGEGGRVWVPRNGRRQAAIKQIPAAERFYFLEEWYPKYGNLVPRDVATRAIHKVVYEHGLGLDGQPMVYLDLTPHRSRHAEPQARRHSRNLREVCRRRPARCADEDLPGHALHDGRALGGLQPDDQYSRHLCGGRVRVPVPRRQPAGRELAVELHLWRIHCGTERVEVSQRALRPRKAMAAAAAEIARQAEINTKLLNNEGTENPFRLWRELGNDDRARHRDPLQQGPEAGGRKRSWNCWSATRR